MKQITLDWETYQRELRKAELDQWRSGNNDGIHQVARYLNDNENIHIFLDDNPDRDWQAIVKAVGREKELADCDYEYPKKEGETK